MKAVTARNGRPSRNSAEARALWRAVGMILLFNGLLLAWVLLKPGGDRVSAIVLNAAGFVGPILVLPLCFGGLLEWMRRRGASRTDDQPSAMRGRRWAPILLGMGILCYVLGQMGFTYYDLVLRQAPPFPSLADIGYLIEYPFFLLGILLLPARPIPVASRARIALDGLMIMTAALTFSWYFVLGPVVQQGTETVLAKVVSAAYPLADIVLIACLVILALRPGEHALRPAAYVLALALGFYVVMDSIYAYQVLNGTYVTGTLFDVGWPVAYMLIGLGAFAVRLAPTRETTPDEPGDTLHTGSSPVEQRVWHSLLPHALVPAVGVLAVYAWRASAGSGSLAAGVYLGGAVLICLVLLRQLLTIVENARLYNRLQRMYVQIEHYLRNVERVTTAAAAVEAGEFDPKTIEQVAAREDELGQLARVFQRMAGEVQAREQRLKQEVQQLRIEIDETRTARQVAEITETDYFRDLQRKADRLRSRSDVDP
jgi:two-component system cell cycle response regulator